MRILHTADWHLGKTLEGRSRHREQEQFISELYDIVVDEQIDVILIAGDVYDTVNPPAVSEQLFYDSLSKLADYGKRKIVVISGNHDNPERLIAASPIAERHGITLVGTPTFHPIQLFIENTGEELYIGALPYPSESRLRALLTEAQEEEALQVAYEQRVQSILTKLCSSFTPSSVNVVMSHLFVAGGSESDSERPIQVGGAYTISPALFPSSAQYVALGHLHRPQNMYHQNTPVRYAGSPLAYSFSEAGQAKSVTIIDAKPGQAVDVKEVYLQSGKPLVRWKATSMQELYSWLDKKRDANSWVDIEVDVTDVISMESIQHIRRAHDGIIHIRPQFQLDQQAREHTHTQNLAIDEQFVRFYERQTGGAKPDEELIDLFFELVTDDEE